MKRIAAFILLGALTVSSPAAVSAQIRASNWPQARSSQKADRKQQKAQKKYAKAQRKAQRKMLKTERKNTRYPTHSY
jgi:F0F1-type ATP synthase epsilon subunit